MIRIDCEEDGFWLTVEDDEDSGGPIEERLPGAEYITIGYRLRLTDPDQLYNLVKDVIGPWIAEREQARAEFDMARSDREMDEGYALDDPKHSSYHERMSALWDEREK